MRSDLAAQIGFVSAVTATVSVYIIAATILTVLYQRRLKRIQDVSETTETPNLTSGNAVSEETETDGRTV